MGAPQESLGRESFAQVLPPLPWAAACMATSFLQHSLMRFTIFIPLLEKGSMPSSPPQAKSEPEKGTQEISRSCAESWGFFHDSLRTWPALALSIALLHKWPLEGAVDPQSEMLLVLCGRGRAHEDRLSLVPALGKLSDESQVHSS